MKKTPREHNSKTINQMLKINFRPMFPFFTPRKLVFYCFLGVRKDEMDLQFEKRNKKYKNQRTCNMVYMSKI